MKWQEYFEYWLLQQVGLEDRFSEEGRYRAFRDRFREEMKDEESRRIQAAAGFSGDRTPNA